MERIKKNFGFGCMRPPMKGEEVDTEQFCRMVDAFLAAGFNYFDTARPYVNGKSENVLRECLTSRHPRESYVLTDKLSGSLFRQEADIRPLFDSQLAACGVDYFDFYLMHAQNRENFERYKSCRAYETALALKKRAGCAMWASLSRYGGCAGAYPDRVSPGGGGAAPAQLPGLG